MNDRFSAQEWTATSERRSVGCCRSLPRAWRRAEDAPPPRKILVVLLSEMGSLVLAQPMFRRLRDALSRRRRSTRSCSSRTKKCWSFWATCPRATSSRSETSSLTTFLSDSLSALKTLRFIGVDTVIDCELFSRVGAILSYSERRQRCASGSTATLRKGLYRGSLVNRPVLYNPYQHIAQQFLTLAEAIDGKGAPVVKRRGCGAAICR